MSSIWNYLSSTWRMPEIFLPALMNSFIFFWGSHFSPSFWKCFLWDFRWPFYYDDYYFSTLNMLLHCLLSHVFLGKNSAIKLSFVPLYMCLFSLIVLKISIISFVQFDYFVPWSWFSSYFFSVGFIELLESVGF